MVPLHRCAQIIAERKRVYEPVNRRAVASHGEEPEHDASEEEEQDLSASAAFSTDWSAVKYIRLTLALNNAASAIGSVSDVLNSGMKIYAE